MKELGTPGGSAEQNIPAVSPAVSRGSSASQRGADLTIQATLQQLSALASGAAASKQRGGSIYLMDQNKPISHSENEGLAGEKIKKESY